MIDILGKPLLDATVTAEHKLWWPVTEALYACTLALEVSGGDERWLRWLRTVHAYAYDKLCDADGGGEWYGYLRPDGTPFNACKGGNYKGFFHVPRCLLTVMKSAERHLAKSGAALYEAYDPQVPLSGAYYDNVAGAGTFVNDATFDEA